MRKVSIRFDAPGPDGKRGRGRVAAGAGRRCAAVVVLVVRTDAGKEEMRGGTVRGIEWMRQRLRGRPRGELQGYTAELAVSAIISSWCRGDAETLLGASRTAQLGWNSQSVTRAGFSSLQASQVTACCAFYFLGAARL